MYFLKYLNIFIISFLFFSCSTVKPKAPEVEYGTYILPKIDISVLSIPIEMELTKYFKEADMAVPFHFKGNEQSCEGVSYSYQFDRKPIQIEGKGKYVDIEIEGKYALNLSYCAKCTDLFGSKNCITPRIPASCGVDEPMRRIKIQYGTMVELKNNFKLNSQTELKKIDAKDKCEITVFKYDATTQLIKEVKKALAEIGGKIDTEIESLDIKKEAESIWNTFNEPLQIDKYGFLTFNPKEIDVRQLRIDGSKLKFNIGLTAQPQVTSFKPEKNRNILPDLSNITKKDGFEINVEIKAEYDSLNSYLKREIIGKIIEIKNQKIILQDCKIYGAKNNQLSLELKFAGTKSGTLYFNGTPTYIDSTQILSFPDLEYDLETKNVLIKSAKFLFNNKITDMLRTYATIDMKQYLNEINTLLNKQINTEISKDIFLKGNINNTNIKTIFPDKDMLILHTILKGNIEVQIN